MYRRKQCFVIAMLLFLACAKLLSVIVHEPVLGYANNYDFIRLEACTGLWPRYASKPRQSSNPEAPIGKYIYNGQKSEIDCVPSFDLIFVKLALAPYKVGDIFDIRAIGVVRAVFLVVLVILLLKADPCPKFRLCVALAAFLIFGDIAFASYFNTLYGEYSVIVGVFVATAALASLLGGGGTILRLLIFVIGIVVLMFAKIQYTFFASLLVVIAVLGLASSTRLVTSAVLLGLAVTGPFAFIHLRGEQFTENMALKTDTFLNAILPTAPDLRLALRTLGMPQRCAASVGMSWRDVCLKGCSPESVWVNHPCPEVLEVNRFRLLSLFTSQPTTLLKPLKESIALSRPWYLSDLGRVETASVDERPFYRALVVTSSSSIFDRLPNYIYNTIIILSVLVAGTFTFIMGYEVFLGGGLGGKRLQVLMSVGGVTVAYALFSSVFGDGYAEVGRHSVALPVGFFIQISSCGVIAIDFFRRRFFKTK
jgi:hypothetical protein